MALTFTPVSSNVIGNQRMNVVNVTFDDSYPTGGEAVTASDLGMRASLDAVVVSASSPYIVEWSSPYLVAYTAVDGTELGDTSDLTGYSVNLIAVGR